MPQYNQVIRFHNLRHYIYPARLTEDNYNQIQQMVEPRYLILNGGIRFIVESDEIC